MKKVELTVPELSARLQYEASVERGMKKQGFVVQHCINLDWFEVMISGRLVENDLPEETYEFSEGFGLNRNIVFAKKELGTKIFKYSYDIYLNGKLFGKCHCCPRSENILRSDFIQFQVQNNVLYEFGGFSDIKFLFQQMTWQVVNVTRFDIALDGVKVLDLVDQFVQGKIEKLGKAKVKPYFTGKRVIEGFDIGSRASNKWITGYKKSSELEKSGKNYIKEFWDKTQLNVEGEVERLELKIRNEEIKKIENFDWKNLDDFEYLASIFRTCMKNFFEFVDITTDSNVTRRKKIEFVNWEFLGASLLPRLSTKETTEIYRLKQSAKTNYWCYLASGQQYYASIAMEQAMNVNCLDWYAKKLEFWKREYDKKTGKNQDGLISFQYFLNFEQYENNAQLKLFEINTPEKI
jgi:hypothetical protein